MFGNGKQPSWWLSISALVIANQVEVGASGFVPHFPLVRFLPLLQQMH